MKEKLGKAIAMMILLGIFAGILFIYMGVGTGILGLLGVKSQSFAKLVLFLLIYFILQNAIDLVGKALADVLKEFEYISEDNKIVQAIVTIVGSIILMTIIDFFMKSVYVKEIAVIIFCIIHYLIEFIINDKIDESDLE